MKIYSIIIVCITLGTFYGLAINLEHQKQTDHHSNEIRISTLDTKKFSKVSEKKMSEQTQGVYYDHNDDFSKQVTGKESRYLHTGISFIESSEAEMVIDKVTMNVSGS